jgi:uncharacterized membrane protein
MLKRIAAALIPLALIALVVLPIVLDQPFGSQTAGTLQAVYTLRRWSPIITVIGVVALAVLAAMSLRRRRSWPAVIGFGGALTMAIAATWFARQNTFEWMFKPLPRPQFVAAAKATFVDANDLVLAVSVDGDAAAYPIRQMAYHHLVNDRIGRAPAVVTY